MKIYKTTNLINNKIYIGQTIRKRKDYIGSGLYLTRAIKKYGKQNFKCEIIIEGTFNNLLLDELEKHYIRLYNSTDKNIGYNIDNGGNSNKELSNESRNKMSESAKNRRRLPLSEETKRKIGDKARGRKFGKEYKENCRLRQLGTKRSLETRQRMSKASLGKPKTDQHKVNISKGKREKPKPRK